MGTPIPYKDYLYILDGGEFNQDKRVFVPCSNSIRISTKSGAVEILEPPLKQRIKGGIVRHE